MLGVTLWRWFLRLVVKTIHSSLSENCIYLQSKMWSQFSLRDAWSVSSAWTWGSDHESVSIQFGIHLCSVLMIMASYEWALLGLWLRSSPGTLCFKLQFCFQGLVFKTRSLVLCILLKTCEAKVQCQFLLLLSILKLQGLLWGHCTTIWIIDFNWFNLVLKWAKTQALSLSEGSKRGAWSSTHL